jgi:hypothetical protein
MLKVFNMPTQTLEKPKTLTKKPESKKVTPKLQSKKKEVIKDLSKTYNEFRRERHRKAPEFLWVLNIIGIFLHIKM